MNDCLFCKIIAREIPATIIAEDEYVVAFLDIHPTNPGHTLIVPKTHIANLQTADKETIHRLFEMTQKIGRAVIKGLGVEGYNVLQNNGTVAGQVIHHLHVHVIPRFAGDGFTHWHGQDYENEQQVQNVAEHIIGALTI